MTPTHRRLLGVLEFETESRLDLDTEAGWKSNDGICTEEGDSGLLNFFLPWEESGCADLQCAPIKLDNHPSRVF